MSESLSLPSGASSSDINVHQHLCGFNWLNIYIASFSSETGQVLTETANFLGSVTQAAPADCNDGVGLVCTR